MHFYSFCEFNTSQIVVVHQVLHTYRYSHGLSRQREGSNEINKQNVMVGGGKVVRVLSSKCKSGINDSEEFRHYRAPAVNSLLGENQ